MTYALRGAYSLHARALAAPTARVISWLSLSLPSLGTSRRAFSVGASDPDDVKVRYGVIVGVLRHDRNAVSDRRSSDPAIVDRRPAACRAMSWPSCKYVVLHD